MRFALTLARVNALTTAAGLCTALVLGDAVLGAHVLQLPFLQDAVEAGRVFPALFAGCGALVVATDWSAFERTGLRPVAGLVAGRWVAGAVVSLGSAVLVSASLTVVTVLDLLLGVLATVLPRYWWLALPVLLYLQLYVPSDLLPQEVLTLTGRT